MRILRRAITGEELWNGNRENFWTHPKLWSDDSLFTWLFKTYWRRKQEYPQLFMQPDYRQLQIMYFKSPGETDMWLSKIA